MQSRRGFTIVELCVVCVILAILITITVSSAQVIMGKAVIASCRYNLRQLYQGFYLYALKYGDILPHKDRDSDSGPNYCWFDKLDPHLGTAHLHPLKQCPAWDGYENSSCTEDLHSIKMNGALCPKDRPPETRVDQRQHHWYWPRLWDIRRKSRTVLLLDGRMDSPYATHTATRYVRPYRDTENRHLQGSNLLFVDGSSQFVDAEKEGISLGEIGWNSPLNFIWQPYLHQ